MAFTGILSSPLRTVPPRRRAAGWACFRCLGRFSGAVLLLLFALLSPATANATSLTFQTSLGEALPSSQVGGAYVVPTFTGASVQAVVSDAVAGELFSAGGSAAPGPKVALPNPLSVVTTVSLARQVPGGPVISSFATVYLVSIGGLPVAPGIPPTGIWSVTFPSGLGTVDVTAMDVGAGLLPKIHLQSELGTSPLSVSGDIAPQPDGTATVSGTAAIADTVPSISYKISPNAIQASFVPGPTPIITLGNVAATLSNLQLNLNPTGGKIATDISVSDPILGKISATNVALTLSSGTLTPTITSGNWSGSGSLSFGSVSVNYGSLAATVTGGKLSIAISNVSFTSSGNVKCPNTSISEILRFTPDGLVGDGGVGTRLTITEPVSLAFPDVCITASSLKIGFGIAPVTLSASFDASITGSWLKSGKITASGLDVTWVPPTTFAIKNPSTFLYTGSPIDLDSLPITTLSADLDTAGRISSAEATVGSEKVSLRFVDNKIIGSVTSATFKYGLMSLGNMKGSFVLSTAGEEQNLFVDQATLSVPQFIARSSTQQNLVLDVSAQAGKDHALSISYLRGKWVVAPPTADLVVDKTSAELAFAIGPVDFSVTAFPKAATDSTDKSKPLLKSAYANCKDSIAVFDREGGVIICGKIQISDTAVNTVMQNYCSRVAIGYNPALTEFDFATILEPPADPSNPPIDADCSNSFNIERVLSAQVVDFGVHWNGITNPEKSTFWMKGQVLVKPASGIPGINSSTFGSALFAFDYEIDASAHKNRIGVIGTISSLEAFSVPNVVNYKISQLDVIASHDFGAKGGETTIVLSAGDSTASFSGPLGLTVYGRGGGVEYHSLSNSWKTRFPGVRLPETILSFVSQVLTNGAAWAFIRHL